MEKVYQFQFYRKKKDKWILIGDHWGTKEEIEEFANKYREEYDSPILIHNWGMNFKRVFE